MAETKLQQRVERGAKWLDEVSPQWITMIDLTRLDLGNSRCCVLGQVYGDYDAGLDEWWHWHEDEQTGDALPEPSLAGFDIDFQDRVMSRVLTDTRLEYRRLTEAWHNYIFERQQAASSRGR